MAILVHRIKRWKVQILLLFVVVFWLIDLISKYKYNGLVYGFDYGLYHPDGSLYTFRTLTWLGHSQQDAGQLVSSWYSTHAYKLQHFDGSSLYFNVNPQWNRFLPRILYPALSVPFVSVFGISGMLAVPALSLLVTMISIFYVGIQQRKFILATALPLLLSISPTVNRWMFINTTDSLLVGLSSVVVVILASGYLTKRKLAILFFLVVLTSYTRVAVLEWIAIAIVMLSFKKIHESLLMAISSIIFFVPSILGNASSAILPNSESHSMWSKLFDFPITVLKVGFYEIAELAVLDRLFLVLLTLGVLFAVMNFSQKSSKYFLAVLLSLWLTGAVNGTIGVNFRYQLPIISFLGWVLIDSAHLAYSKISQKLG